MKTPIIKLLPYLLCFSCITSAQGDYSKLHGKVTNKSGIPLSGAIVVLMNKNVYTTTNSDGIYDFSLGVKKTSINTNSSLDNTNKLHYRVKVSNNILSFSLNERKYVNLEIYNLKGKCLTNILNKHLTKGSHSIPLTVNMKSKAKEMLLVRSVIGSCVSTFKYIPMAYSTAYATQTMRQTVSPRARFSPSNDIVRISDPGYITSILPISGYDKPVNTVLDTLIAKTGVHSLLDGSMDRLTIYGKTQYFWGKIGTKDAPLVKAITSNGPKVVDVALMFNPFFIDLTYGKNKIGWKNHHFHHLITSDHVEIAFQDLNDNTAFQAKIDLLSKTDLVPSGYATLGVFGREGKILKGNASDVVSFGTSFDDNVNYFGYHKFKDSPKTDSKYTPDPKYPFWEYIVVYRLTIKKSAFNSIKYKNITMTYVHASPSKTGRETVEVTEKIGSLQIDPFKFIKTLNISGVGHR